MKKIITFIKENWFKIGILIIPFIFLISLFSYLPEIPKDKKQDCNVANVKLQGQLFVTNNEITTDNQNAIASEDVIQKLQDAQNNKKIRAIILTVNSGGGSMVGGEQIMTTLKSMTKPTVALIEDLGLSAAYYGSTGANVIFASKFSDVVDIGITASFVENSQKDKQDGLTYVPLYTGKYKDMFNQDKPMTDDEKTIVMSNIQVAHDNFVAGVAENRNIPIETVKSFAQGLTMTSQDALKNKFIDQIGTILDVKNYLSKKLNTKVKICE